MVEAVVVSELDAGLEEVAKSWGGEEIGFGAVGDDAAIAHEEDTVDFREDVGDVMGDEENAGSLLGQRTEEIAEVALGGEIEGVGRFIEEEHAGGSHQCAADHDAALLAGGHLAHEFIGERDGVDLLKNLVGAEMHCWSNREVGPKGGTGEEASEDGIAPSGVKSGFPREFG